MKKIELLSIVAFAICSIFFSSCAPTKITESHRTKIAKTGVLDPFSELQNDRNITPSTMAITPLVCDLKVSEERIKYVKQIEISGEDKEYVATESELCNIAITEAAKVNNADVIVAPTYEVDITRVDNNIKGTVTIYGYPAVYSNFRNASLEDSWIFYPTERFESDLEVENDCVKKENDLLKEILLQYSPKKSSK